MNEEASKFIRELERVDREVLTILRSDPLNYVKARLDRVIVGEDLNKLALFLSYLSYLRKDPTHVVLKGESSIGKTYLMLNVAEAFPSEDIIRVSRVTPAWLDYMKDKLKHKILLVEESGGVESASFSLHVMMTEKGLRLGTVRRTENGSWEPYFVEVEGPISFASTTTAISLDSHMETRTFSIFPDASKEQTRRIQEQQMRFDAYPWEREEALNAVKEVRKLVAWIRDFGVKEVVIPYSKLIELPSDKVRVRRDRPKLIEMIKSLAMLRQLNRIVIERNGVKYVCAEWQDAKDAITICGGILARTLRELSTLEERVLNEAKRHFSTSTFNAMQIAAIIGKSQTTVRKCLNELVRKGYVFLEEEGRGRGMSNRYSLNLDALENPEKTVFADFNGISDSTVRNTLKAWVDENSRNALIYKYNEEGRLVRLHP
jgi:DNA-binding transcriptional ArsR family regulator